MTTRREFLKVSAAAGGGIALGFPMAAHAQGVAPEINAWVVIQPNDVVVIRYARSEMGQGSMTSAAQLVAEELECDWNKVRVEYADTNQHVKRKRAWGDMAAVGSRTIRQSQQTLRTAGATATPSHGSGGTPTSAGTLATKGTWRSCWSGDTDSPGLVEAPELLREWEEDADARRRVAWVE